ncbi:hypothetical protein FQR65_LT02993 [Abscondita terminalis]|nr:hypothetical protein FQR65_LT02993 [Abscondita terminalis]
MDARELNNGPNQIGPANNSTATKIDERVKLKIPDIGKSVETIPPTSVPGLFTRIASCYPVHPALSYKNSEGIWKSITYREYQDQVRTCAKAFIHLGLERHKSVCILGFNSPEWFISSFAAIHAGGISAGIYSTNSSASCLHCATKNDTNIFVVQDEKQLEKILKIKDQLPYLKAIVQYEGTPQSPDVLSWQTLMKIGREQGDEYLEKRLRQITVNECCILIFTSGTVGQPKAAMLSHDNITWQATVLAEVLQAGRGEDHIISYLPLSHIAAQVVDMYISLVVAGTTHFADKNALKGTLITTMKEVRPTYFIGVPRVWEKIYENMISIGAQSGYMKRCLGNWAKQQGYNHNICKIKGRESSNWGYALANWLVFKRIKNGLGLDRCKATVSAAAPLSLEIKKYFLSLDIPVIDAFGLSETSGAHAIPPPNRLSMEGVGPTINGMKTKILLTNDETTGEICVYGRHVFMGYLGDPEKTMDAIDEDGWLHTGDIGYIDKEELLHITGRSKELIITAGGENIPPVLIEQTVKQELPYVNNVMLVGDKRKYLSLLITLRTEVDADAKPLDGLSVEVKQWLKALSCPAETITEVLAAGPHPKLLQAIGEGIQRANEKAISRAQRIQKFAILPKDFSIVGEELGPTLKLKRNVVAAKYADIIEKLYSGPE